MMKKLIISAAVIGLAGLTSCSTTEPLTATNNEMGEKEGRSTNTCLFGVATANADQMQSASRSGKGFNMISAGTCFNNKNHGVIDAARNGGISEVATVDLKKTNYVFFSKYELIVTGK